MLTAMAMAMPASVTVSMGEETSGVLRVIRLVSAEVRSCACGGTRAERRRLQTHRISAQKSLVCPLTPPRGPHSPPGPP